MSSVAGRGLFVWQEGALEARPLPRDNREAGMHFPGRSRGRGCMQSQDAETIADCEPVLRAVSKET